MFGFHLPGRPFLVVNERGSLILHSPVTTWLHCIMFDSCDVCGVYTCESHRIQQAKVPSLKWLHAICRFFVGHVQWTTQEYIPFSKVRSTVTVDLVWGVFFKKNGQTQH